MKNRPLTGIFGAQRSCALTTAKPMQSADTDWGPAASYGVMGYSLMRMAVAFVIQLLIIKA
ncbi:hypothetical protein FHS15_005744 [Paenibacillus castaneae]|uniref:hypothetical protein n=1 Tax=Paenibacillus castaneae TaxID=474957 RepID=UPI000C9B5BA7|nr:hypothetical protein [Paenibacillus castaneae]NIK80554.1 hypothetical protein [Paenibacillus castaneae]